MKVRVKKDKCEWLDGDIRSMMRSRNYYHREFQKSRSQEVWEKYRALSNEVNRKVRQAKVTHFSTICQELKKQPIDKLGGGWTLPWGTKGRFCCEPPWLRQWVPDRQICYCQQACWPFHPRTFSLSSRLFHHLSHLPFLSIFISLSWGRRMFWES